MNSLSVPTNVSAKSIARNTALNLAGQIIPLVAALIAIPFVLKGLGTERFGLLNLIWVTISYFSLFDFGLGRALTQIIAEKVALKKDEDIPQFVTSALALLFGTGILAVVASIFLSPLLVSKILAVPQALQTEARHAFNILALSIPFIISASALRGVLEAKQRFGLINLVRIPTGVLIFIGPLGSLLFTRNLIGISAVLAIGQLLSWGGFLVMCLRVLPCISRKPHLQKAVVLPLLKSGGWMTVSNILSPLMVYLDRFFIGSIISLSAVSYYSTPFEVVTRLWIIPGALLRVLFPIFTETFITDRTRSLKIMKWGYISISLATFPIVIIVCLFAREALGLWLGVEFAAQSSLVLQILAIGVFINGLGQIPFAFIQASGRSDVTGKIHMIELPFYALFAWALIMQFGIMGAALAWSIRILIDTTVLLSFSRCLMAEQRELIKRVALEIGLCVVIFSLGIIIRPFAMRVIYGASVLFLFMLISRKIVLKQQGIGTLVTWIKM